jgi:tetratricopeptide (TPR) repeat protein
MAAFCTYCSREKDTTAAPLPAWKRYRSARISKVAELASEGRVRFLILSGRFGLVESNELIPYYDHLLLDGEVQQLAEVVAGQIKEMGIDRITFFADAGRYLAQVRPYISTIQRACSDAGITLAIEILEVFDMSDWRSVMAQAERAKKTFVGNQPEGEKAFEILLSSYPSDAMVYFKRGEAWEEVRQLELALSDYRRATELFPMRKWKETASEAAERTGRQIAIPPRTSEDPVDFQLSEPGTPFIPDVKKTLELLGKEPQLGCVKSRTLLEHLVADFLQRHAIDSTGREGLYERIEAVKGLFPRTTINHMHTIRVQGNEAAHGGAISLDDARVVAYALIAVLKALFPLVK